MKLKIIAALVLVISLLVGFVLPLRASATNYGNVNILDDSVMNNTGSMSDSQIQGFLNGFAGNCLGGSFTTPDPQGYSGGGYQFGGNVSGGTAIKNIATRYNLNPQVLLATLEKESGLISRNGNCHYESMPDAPATYKGSPVSCGSGTSYSDCSYACLDAYHGGCLTVAVGYACPGFCKKSFANFGKQMSGASWVLRFAEARAYGQLTGYSGYDSNDEYITYTGPMTTGNRQRVTGGTSVYYDGSYTDVDGNTMHIANGSTASMLNYTPFYARSYTDDKLFHTSFTNWFGSTSYRQPLGSRLAVDNQTGQIYFISLANNTRYAIPSWSTLEAYGLNGYPIIPMDHSAVTGYSDGGVLRTLVWNSNTQSLFLVDHGQKYSFSQYCSAWGLDCLGNTPGSVSNLNNTYFDQVLINGGSNQPLMQVNGQFFFMNNGTRSPFASAADMQAAGYTNTQAVPIIQTDLNATQALGALQQTLPKFLTFNGNLMLYFDSQSYHQVPNLATYAAWGSQPVTIPPPSATDSSLPTYDTLGIWIKDSNNSYFLIDGGKKMDITADPTNWHSTSFQTMTAAGLNTLQAITEQHNIYSQGSVYFLQSNTLRPVPSPEDYYGLGMNSGNTVSLSTNAISTIPAGPSIMRDGAAFTIASTGALYLANNNTGLYVPSVAMALDFGVNWPSIRFNLPASTLNAGGYPSAGTLTRWVKPVGGGLTYVTNRSAVAINSTAASTWGINTTTQPSTAVNPATLFNATGSATLGQFVRNLDDGGMYYGTSGASHYIEAYSAFINLGGATANILNVHSDFLTATPRGYTYGW